MTPPVVVVFSSSSSSSNGNTTDEKYTFGVLGVPLEVFQEHLRMRVASGSRAGRDSVQLCCRHPFQNR